MPITKTTDLDNAVVVNYLKEYLLIMTQRPGLWAQFISWQPPVTEDVGYGSSFDYPIFGEVEGTFGELVEDADIVPHILNDSNMTLTPGEYGDGIALSKKSRYQSRVNLPQIVGKVLAAQRMKKIDDILRRPIVGWGSLRPTYTYHIDGSAAMSSLSAADAVDNVTYAFLSELGANAASTGYDAFEGMGYTSPIHPLLAMEIQGLTEWKTMGYYQDMGKLTNTLQKPFTLAGITFLPSHEARIYLGAGALHATTVNTTVKAAYPIAQGAVSFRVTSATNIAAGQYLTIGTVETETNAPSTNLEQVYVTGVTDTDLVAIRTRGINGGSGFRYDHAVAEPVAYRYNVAAIPILGKESILGVHGSDTGRYGKVIIKTGLDLLDRFTYYSWYWYGGVGAVQSRVILGKVALSNWIMGSN